MSESLTLSNDNAINGDSRNMSLNTGPVMIGVEGSMCILIGSVEVELVKRR